MDVRCGLDFQMDLNYVKGERKHLYYQFRKARNPGDKFSETRLKKCPIYSSQSRASKEKGSWILPRRVPQKASFYWY